MIDSGSVALGREEESVATLNGLDVGHDPHPGVVVELLELLHDLAEAPELPLEPRAFPELALAEPARSSDGRVPPGVVGSVDDGAEHAVDGLLDDLRSG
jgi:hypothetical protein